MVSVLPEAVDPLVPPVCIFTYGRVSQYLKARMLFLRAFKNGYINEVSAMAL